MGEWKEKELKFLTTKIGSGATPRGGSNSYKTEGISLIRSQNVLDFSFSIEGLAFIDEGQASLLENVKVEPNDILLNITGDSVARCCVVPDSVLPARVNQHVAIIRPDKNEINGNFVFYYLQHIKDELLSQAEIGATRRALTKGMIEDLNIPVPTPTEQKAIAFVLSSFDDKIDLLHRQNKTLEAMAETLFLQWFIEGENSKLYSMEELLESVSIKHEFPSESIKFLNTSDVFNGYVIPVEDQLVSILPGQAKKSIQKGDILYSEIRPKNRHYAYIDFEANNFVVSTKLMVLRSKGILNQSVVLMFIKRKVILDYLQMLAEGRSGTFPQITFDEFKTIKIHVPKDIDTLNNLSATISTIHKRLLYNDKTRQEIESFRDTLLPKLMSGKVKVDY